MGVETISRAVLAMDESLLELEQLKAVYDQRATLEELDLMKGHLKSQESAPKPVPLAKPDSFLLDVSRIHRFIQRAECWIFKDMFCERLFDCGERVGQIDIAIDELRTCERVQQTLATVLELGNFMNYGTNRGSANGFHLEILRKLKDVKSVDGSTTLIHYVVNTILAPVSDSGPDEASPVETCPMPDPDLFKHAAEHDYDALAAELKSLKTDFEKFLKKVAEVNTTATTDGEIHPFKEEMDEFAEDTQGIIDDQFTILHASKSDFAELVDFFAFVPLKRGADPTPKDLFDIWREFCADFRVAWKAELRRIAKRKLDAARKEKDRLRQEALQSKQSLGRKAGGSVLATKLKNKFRKKAPVATPTKK
jgi:hypothetical protein